MFVAVTFFIIAMHSWNCISLVEKPMKRITFDLLGITLMICY